MKGSNILKNSFCSKPYSKPLIIQKFISGGAGFLVWIEICLLCSFWFILKFNIGYMLRWGGDVNIGGLHFLSDLIEYIWKYCPSRQCNSCYFMEIFLNCRDFFPGHLVSFFYDIITVLLLRLYCYTRHYHLAH